MKKPLRKALSGIVTAALIFSALPGVSVSAIEKAPKSETAIKNMLNMNQSKQGKRSSISKEKNQQFADKTLMIKYKTPISAQAHQRAGGKLIQRVAALGYDIVQINGKVSMEKAAKNYVAMPNVSAISKSALLKQAGSPDLKASAMYHLNTLNIPEASKLAGKNKVRVAVVDTGIDAKHPELKNKIKSNNNVMNPAQKGTPDVHGTHVSGIIAAEKNNGTGGYGINPNVDLISIDVFNRSFFANDYVVAQGILKAIDQKAQVINLSLSSMFPSPIIEEAVQKAIDANITVVAAAGNSGMNLAEYPASFEGVISVGSTNNKNKLSSYSTFGPGVDVVAPGEEIYSSVYDAEKGSSFAKMSGTSMASPAVAGVVSLMLSKNPKLTPYQINYILNKTAKDLGSKGYDISYGNGLVDPVAALTYNVKNVPANPKLSLEKRLGAAKAVTPEEGKSLTVSGLFKKMNQMDLYKLNVKKGEFVQTKLTGSANYDLVLGLDFYKGKETKPASKLKINDQGTDGAEGTLFEAKEDGVLLVYVKDAYGNYSESNLSKYGLTIEKSSSKLEDTNTLEKPDVISALPYHSETPLYYTDESAAIPPAEEGTPGNGEEGSKDEEGTPPGPVLKGDSDYFTFKTGAVKSGELMKFTVSGVPGIDPNVKLSMMVEEQGEKYPMEMGWVDSNRTGLGEEYIFKASPNSEYTVEVTNKPSMDAWIWMMMTGQQVIDLDRNYSSHLPYQVSLSSHEVPLDEDNFPEMNEGGSEEGTATPASPAAVNKRDVIIEQSSEEGSYEEYIQRILSNAIPYKAESTVKGYVQYMGDEDWYAFTPDEHAVYDFTFSSGKDSLVPSMEIYRYDPKVKEMVPLGANAEMTDTGYGAAASYAAGLKKGQTYYLKMAHVQYDASLSPYEFTARPIMKNTADKYETNDNFTEATPLGLTAVEGNFSSIGDQDTYYFKPAVSGLYGYTIQPMPEKNAKLKAPEKIKVPIDPVLVTIEDTNGNGKLDSEEEGNFIVSDYGFDNDPEAGSLEGKAGKGYFVLALNYWSDQTTVTPYKLTMAKMGGIDEDRGSVFKKGIPSKPAVLKNGKAKGYFQSIKDSDTYTFTLRNDKKLTASLKTPFGLDGKVTVIDSKGKVIWTADQYGAGDSEIFSLSLKKGKYYVKVEEAMERVSMSPYELTIK
ncbi:peptidase S8/S53 subtilisin kexin sedolisin [Bacillus sp. FJAT-42376]|uniref:S8 family serine peptidase n=1 Tax=Bacillus sp. FJAT-42376 TaxID=2014076 RepID=UPI000F4F587E|nr:S8 family serine peptidase [Bacillus sp. FJAT-42376]AZB44596.1 peptidase S8/S53 subtilisin kexin sedolisin [Bacillus sp. FJAT-42376]